MLNFTKSRNFLCQAVVLVALSLLLVACTASRGDSPALTQNSQTIVVSTMKLESSAFAANGLIPAEYTCDGSNISPALNWGTPPAKTQSLALIVEDPDAPGGTYTHWMIYNLPAIATGIPEGVTAQPILLQPQEIKGAVQGKNDFGKIGYGGPCPPSGTHRYFFKLYAVDRQLNLTTGITKEQLLLAMDGHILATAELIGRYLRT